MAASEAFDGRLYPGCAAYLSRLPAGLDSYPTCTTSPVFANAAWREFKDVLQAESLPDPIRRRLRGSLPISSWIPVTTVAIMSLVLREAAFKSDADFEAKMFVINREIFESHALRAVMQVLSPSLMLAGASMRWSAFYKGCTLKSVKAGKSNADLRLEFPTHLFPPVLIMGMATAVRAAVAGTRCENPITRVSETSASHAIIRVSWS